MCLVITLPATAPAPLRHRVTSPIETREEKEREREKGAEEKTREREEEEGAKEREEEAVTEERRRRSILSLSVRCVSFSCPSHEPLEVLFVLEERPYSVLIKH